MAENDVDVSWDEAREANLKNWNDRVDIHVSGYGLAAYDDPGYISDVVRDDLESLSIVRDGVQGLDVCHLQCHIGTDTLSLARAGARVTGLDFSLAALEAAERFATEHGERIRWVHSDVMDAAAAIGDDFDLVYTSIGTICWLQDLDAWAAQVEKLLRPGGTFFIRDGHPALYSLDETASDLRIRYRYFPNGDAQTWNDSGTYSGDGVVAHPRTYEWPHSISEIVNALIGAGLTLQLLDEGKTLPWQFSPRMEQTDGGWAWPESERDNVPCTFTIIARKPDHVSSGEWIAFEQVDETPHAGAPTMSEQADPYPAVRSLDASGSCTIEMGVSYHFACFGVTDDEYMAADEDVVRHRVGSLFEAYLGKPGGFMLLTAVHTGRIRVSIHSTTEPAPSEIDLDDWQDMIITTIDVPSGELVAQPCFGDGETSTNLVGAAGRYGIRILGRDRDVLGDDLEIVSPESYRIDIWPAPEGVIADSVRTTSVAGREIEAS